MERQREQSKVAVTFSPSPTVAGPAGSTERDSTDGGVTSDSTRGGMMTTEREKETKLEGVEWEHSDGNV